MQEISSLRRGLIRVASLAVVAGFVAACAGQQGGPAPVYMHGAATTGAAPVAPVMAAPIAPIHREAHQAGVHEITVQAGQSVNSLAKTHHVTPDAIIAANHLQPPYTVKVGSRLAIPEADGAPASMAAGSAPAPQHVAAIPLTPPAPAQSEPTAPQAAVEAPQSLMPVASPPPQPKQAALPPQQQAALTPPASKTLPDIVPLDGPPAKDAAAPAQPPRQAVAEPPPAPPPTASGAPSVLAPRNAAAALPLPGEVSAEPVVASAGRFAWPVQGRVLAGYGAASNGGRNDGINIASPRGTPVRSIDTGTVAYVGNEVKGYGNLVLVKHDNGWISAYAHLDDPLVKVGQKIASGQVIGKVGTTGGVGEPQLHFELRRGKQPVDPREFLAPAPSAGGGPGNKAG
jgi:murein DD-endopeptidase MepM/ murein hydrolase activator NlpD